jgi:phage terminase large subunit GpA-like protein
MKSQIQISGNSLEWSLAKLAIQPLRARPALSVQQWADKNRILSQESSAEPGRWYTERAYYQAGIMNAFSDPYIEKIVCMTAAQVGKTEILNNVVGYFIDHDPSPILVVQPTLDIGKAYSKDRLAPMLRDSPALKGRVKDVKSKDSHNTVLYKKFVGGHITIAGANSAASLASRPIRIVLCDEVDRYPVSAGTEGDPVDLAFKRATTFWNRKVGIVSTPTLKNFSRIEKAYEESDMRKFYVPCPACSEMQILRWANVKWPKDRPLEAVYVCEFCGTEIGDADKIRMVRQGVWKAERECKGVAGFWLNELYSPWISFGNMASRFLQAKHKGQETLKVFINTALAETWEEEGESISDVGIMGRREKYEAEAPMGVGLLTSAADVQQDRIEVLTIGWGISEEAWI